MWWRCGGGVVIVGVVECGECRCGVGVVSVGVVEVW